MAGFDKNIAYYGLEQQVIASGYVSQKACRQYMRGADVLVLLQTITGEGSDVISGKIFEYFSARKAILAVVPRDGGDAWMVNKEEK